MKSVCNIRPKLLLLSPLGSEVRQFSHSGMIRSLLDRGWDVVVAAKHVDDDFVAQFDARAKCIAYPKDNIPFFLHHIIIVLDKAHSLLEKKRGKSGWQYKKIASHRMLDKIIYGTQDFFACIASNMPFLFKTLQHLERVLLKRLKTPKWDKAFEEFQPRIILMNVPNVISLLPVLVAAKIHAIKTALVYHTFKDVSANGRLNCDFDFIGVWNDLMKSELLRQNPYIKSEKVKTIGCSHFDCIGRPEWLLPEAKFRQQIGARSGARLLLFPASAPWVVPQEERYIAHLWEAVQQPPFEEDIQLVVRLNPMDDTTNLQNALKKIAPDILVSRPDWRWDKKNNWCFQRKSDLLLYNSLLSYASVCVGIPSTVTIECAVARLPVINIGFDLPGQQALNGPLKAFWQADFYREVRESRSAALADSPETLMELLQKSLKDRYWMMRGQNLLLQQQLGVSPGKSAECTVALLTGLSSFGSIKSLESS